MRPRVTGWLACPVCGGDLAIRDSTQEADAEIQEGALVCPVGHTFPIAAGVPRLAPDELLEDGRIAAESIRESFSHEWKHFDHAADRTWGAPVERRLEEFLRHVDLPAEAVAGKQVLDAGCGNGSLSRAIASLDCEVLAADIGRQVVEAHRQLGGGGARVHYVQANLMHPPFRRDAFDVVYCAGVLHHTPSTKATFDVLVPALAPGGTIFVWLYHHVPGRVLALKSRLRRGISRLPAGAKERLVRYVILPQAMLRQYVRTALRRNPDPRDHLRWRERLVILLDSYTPRYRWEHTPEELAGWYRELGFVDIAVTERGRWGFGVAARRPAQPVG
jgi:SAM-dependent methyltransferase